MPPTRRRLYQRACGTTGRWSTIAASAPDLVEALELFSDLQSLRHQADYDHDAAFDKLVLLTACQDAERARALLASSPPAASEAVFTLLTVRRKDFRER